MREREGNRGLHDIPEDGKGQRNEWNGFLWEVGRLFPFVLLRGNKKVLGTGNNMKNLLKNLNKPGKQRISGLKRFLNEDKR